MKIRRAFTYRQLVDHETKSAKSWAVAHDVHVHGDGDGDGAHVQLGVEMN